MAGSYHLMPLAGDYRDDKDAERRGRGAVGRLDMPRPEVAAV